MLVKGGPEAWSFFVRMAKINLPHLYTEAGTNIPTETTIGLDNALSPARCQAFIGTNAGLMLMEPFRTNTGDIWIKYNSFHTRKCIWKCRLQSDVSPFCWIFHSNQTATVVKVNNLYWADEKKNILNDGECPWCLIASVQDWVGALLPHRVTTCKRIWYLSH